MASIDHWNFRAAHKATETVYGKTPDYTREGGESHLVLFVSVGLQRIETERGV